MRRLNAQPIALYDVSEIAPAATAVVAAFASDFEQLLDRTELHHIGATALPFGRTKGDVDINVRVDAARFAALVAALEARLEIAQPENWTDGFASFNAPGYALPLGIQLTAIGSENDYLLSLRDRMRAEPDLLRRYDEVKSRDAGDGAEAYWQAKNAFLSEVLAS